MTRWRPGEGPSSPYKPQPDLSPREQALSAILRARVPAVVTLTPDGLEITYEVTGPDGDPVQQTDAILATIEAVKEWLNV